MFTGRIRSSPTEFVVTELLNTDFSDDGEHDWLWVEKIGANTTWLAEQLARHASISPRDIGYAGLKDRHAVTRQWFSVRRPSADGTNWASFEADGVSILEKKRHRRKLKRGGHKGNIFRIAIRSSETASLSDEIETRIATIRIEGVPNYFGEQRFGRDGGNIELGRSVIAGRRLPRNKRSIGISAIRSLEFNNELDTRVRDATWNRILPGDVANLDGSRSVFTVDEVTPELEQRCTEMDIHPSGCLPGIDELGVEPATRPLRLRVQNLKWEIEGDALWLEFSLGRGSYATAVLRELAQVS
ncbi:MAG: tRNA pseudouridine(13) synthase TruD [Desulfobulbaceae bacterium]|nr:tRNA pseudouridine(13) synthase TruD [Desulfobulbaceae bacterium]